MKIDAHISFNICCNPQPAQIQCWLSPKVYKTHFDGHNYRRSHGFTLRAYACQIFNWGLKDLKAPTQSLIWCIWISRLPSVAEGVAYYGGHLVCHQCYLYHHKLLQVLFVCQVCILLWSTDSIEQVVLVLPSVILPTVVLVLVLVLAVFSVSASVHYCLVQKEKQEVSRTCKRPAYNWE